MEQKSTIPAECLAGLTVENGWYVNKMIQRSPHSTGGNFSSGYEVEKDGKKAYLKAVDFSRALQNSDMLKELEIQLKIFNFEKELLELCKNENLHKVVVPIDSGKIEVPGFPPILNVVHYIIFYLKWRMEILEKSIHLKKRRIYILFFRHYITLQLE